MIQERVRQNLKGSGRVGGGNFPYDVRRSAYIQTYMDYIKFLKLSYVTAFSREIGRSKSDDSNRGAIKSVQEI